MGVVAAKKRRELLNICVRKKHVYSFPDPTVELSYTCMWNGTIFILLCSSHGGIFREKKLRVCYLVSILKSYMGANNCIDFFYFLTQFKERGLPHFLCYIRFDSHSIRLTYPDIESLREIYLQKQKRDYVKLPADRILIGVRTLTLQTICLFLNMYIYTLNTHLVFFKQNARNIVSIQGLDKK